MNVRPDNPLSPILQKQGVVVLDGGLATTLEARGYTLHPTLWSAGVLLDDPSAIAQVHSDFMEAGADCVTTATYQASFEGLKSAGLDEDQARESFQLATRLAVVARDRFWVRHCHGGRVRPVVAASIGPYGAYLADGSEYRGDYSIGHERLRDFHRRRFELLSASGADLIACETIPSIAEVSVLLEILDDVSGTWSWISVSCRDAGHMSDGTPLTDFARMCEGRLGLCAVGINCVQPDEVTGAVRVLSNEISLPVLAYPNSGERYSARTKRWEGASRCDEWGLMARQWVEAGAQGVGGCCRVGPDAIALTRRALGLPME